MNKGKGNNKRNVNGETHSESERFRRNWEWESRCRGGREKQEVGPLKHASLPPLMPLEASFSNDSMTPPISPSSSSCHCHCHCHSHSHSHAAFPSSSRLSRLSALPAQLPKPHHRIRHGIGLDWIGWHANQQAGPFVFFFHFTQAQAHPFFIKVLSTYPYPTEAN